MRNPMWFVEEKLAKVKVGTRALERQLARSAGAVSDKVGVDAEVFRQVIHRMMLLMIEAALLSLVRQLMPAPSIAQIYPLPVPKPVA